MNICFSNPDLHVSCLNNEWYMQDKIHFTKAWEYLFKKRLTHLKNILQIFVERYSLVLVFCFILMLTTTTEGHQSKDTWCSFLWFPEFQGLMMAMIELAMLMTVIMLKAEIFSTGKMKNLIFEMGLLKLSFLFSLPFSTDNNR